MSMNFEFPFLLIVFIIGCSHCKSILESNDTALEHLNNCKCVLDIHCYNGSLNYYGIGIMTIRYNENNQTETNRIKCSKPSHVCCKETSENGTEKRPVFTFLIGQPEGTDTRIENRIDKSDEECGKQKPIINIRVLSNDDMTLAVDGEFPWMVSIHKRNQLDRNIFEFKCAGTLITDRVVLTAAHCLHGATKRPAEFKILANAKKELGNIGDDPKQERDVEKLIVHPNYYAGGGHNDIALMILKGSYNESRRLNNVCVPGLDLEYDTTKCLATGWGVGKNEIQSNDRILKKVELPIVDHADCEKLLRKTRLGNNFQLHNSFLCAGGSKGRDTCKGDGGGPLICPHEDKYFIQIGIVSWGVDCGKENLPAVYTDVTKFKDWIQSSIKNI